MISAWLIGDTEIVAKLQAAPDRINRGLVRTVTKLCLQLQGHVQRDKLSGQVLKVRTGNLRRSITNKVEQTATSVTGIVGTNVPYGRTHEYGFSGTETVKEHLRTITKAFGRDIRGGAKQIQIRSYSRKVSLPERSFLRSALRDMEGQIKTEMEAALKEAVK